MDWQAILFALLGGVGPAVLWLIFWLQEDSLHPEPKSIIVDTFSIGMVMAAVALLLENMVKPFFPAFTAENASTGLIFVWVAIEETLKFLGAYIIALRSRQNDEPIDAMIYLITVALGFSAAENSLYIIGPILSGNFVETIAVGNLRFIGTTVLHTVTSGVIGVAAAYAFRISGSLKKLYLFMGLILAIILHLSYNLIILKGNEWLFVAFGSAWLGAVMLIVIFERIKKRHAQDEIEMLNTIPQ